MGDLQGGGLKDSPSKNRSKRTNRSRKTERFKSAKQQRFQSSISEQSIHGASSVLDELIEGFTKWIVEENATPEEVSVLLEEVGKVHGTSIQKKMIDIARLLFELVGATESSQSTCVVKEEGCTDH
ncbi:MAG: hypothetical protein P1U42_11255 [Phycisphaerales bacterium]|nr:hypothetical protein [Phycisphaerales bacterium]